MYGNVVRFGNVGVVHQIVVPVTVGLVRVHPDVPVGIVKSPVSLDPDLDARAGRLRRLGKLRVAVASCASCTIVAKRDDRQGVVRER